jgi:hypothetical protein
MFLEPQATVDPFHTQYYLPLAHLMFHPPQLIATEELHILTHMLPLPMDMRQLPMLLNKAQMDNGSPILMSQHQVEVLLHIPKLHQHTEPSMEVLPQLFLRLHNMEELKQLLNKKQLIQAVMLLLFQLKPLHKEVLKQLLQALPTTQMVAQSPMLTLLLQTVKLKVSLTLQSPHQMVELLHWLQEQPLMERVSQIPLLHYHHQHLPQHWFFQPQFHTPLQMVQLLPTLILITQVDKKKLLHITQSQQHQATRPMLIFQPHKDHSHILNQVKLEELHQVELQPTFQRLHLSVELLRLQNQLELTPLEHLLNIIQKPLLMVVLLHSLKKHSQLNMEELEHTFQVILVMDYSCHTLSYLQAAHHMSHPLL